MLSIGGYSFKGKAPLAYRVLNVVTLAHFAAMFALVMGFKWWTFPGADPVHTQPIWFRGESLRYCHPALGYYLFFGAIALVALLLAQALLLWRNRDRVEGPP